MNISAASLSQELVAFRNQALSLLMDSSSDNQGSFESVLRSVAASGGASTSAGTQGGLSATGRNMSLFDPESAFNMMSVINQKEVDYKAQYSELSEMKSDVSELAGAADALAQISADSSSTEIHTQVQTFVDQYNAWVKRFDGDMKQGGILAGTQAAQVARWELDQSMESRFYGVDDGLNGLKDIGITIDKATGMASFDANKLDATLATNRQGAIDTIDEFSANFAGAAKLLNSAGNFIPNQLNNLGSAIHYINDNIASWRSEFGTGAAASSSGQVAQAVAAYNAAAAA
jgi:flagellar capping protein FliD